MSIFEAFKYKYLFNLEKFSFVTMSNKPIPYENTDKLGMIA